MNKYSAAYGGLSNADAQILGDLINVKFKGKITAPQLLKEASSKSSKIHHLFEWNDSIAAHEYRLNQARRLIVSVYVDSDDDAPMRSFLKVNIGSGNTYMDCDVVRDSPDLIDQVLTSAKDQLLRWQDRYSRYCDFFDFKFSMRGQKHGIKEGIERRKTANNSRYKPKNRPANNRRNKPSISQSV